MEEKRENRHTRRFKTASWILSILVMIIGATVLFGRIFNIELFANLFMEPNAALCFVFSGIALWLMQEDHANKNTSVMVRFIGAIIALTGLLSMAELIPGNKITVDAAMSFLAAGTAFIFFDSETKRGGRSGQYLMLIVGSVSMTILFSYFFILVHSYAVAPHTPMSFGSTIGFLAIFFSYMFTCPEKGVMKYFINDDASSVTARTIVPGIVMVPVIIEMSTVFAMRIGILNILHEHMLSSFLIVAVFLLILLRTVNELKRMDDEKQKAAEILKESEARFRALTDNARDITLVLSPEGRIEYASLSVKRIMGYAPEQLRGRNVFEIIHPDDIERVRDSFIEVQRRPAGEQGSTYSRVLHADGSWHSHEGIGTNLIDDPGVRGFVLNTKDVTDERKAQDELEAAKEFAESLIETANTMVVGLDMNGNIAIFNRAAEEITGYKKDEIKKANWFELLVPKDRYPQVWDIFVKLPSGGLPKNFENPILTKTGEERYIAWQNSEISEHGKIIGSVSFGIDITEKRKAEQELSEYRGHLEELVKMRTEELQAKTSQLQNEVDERTKTESQLNYLIESLPGSFYFYDVQENRLARWNKQLETVSGYSEKELPNIDLLTLIAEKDRQRFASEVGRALQEGRAEGEADHVTKDGRLIPSYFSGTRIDLNGRPFIIGMAIDITQRKQMEADLVKAKEMAESANRAKTSFLANMSHELRTPLNSIIGFSDVLKEGMSGQLNEKQKEYVDIIIDSGRHLLSLIDDILDLSTIEAGKIVLNIAQFDMKDLIDGCVNMLGERAAKRGIDVLKSISEAGGPVWADERRIRQVLYNLLSNAIKFTPDGEKIGVEAHRKDNEIQVTVWDTGIGVELDYKGNIFREFEQVESGYTRKYEGSGLGLAISKRIIDLHHGRIWFGSEGKDKGSKFSFAIPIKYTEGSAS